MDDQGWILLAVISNFNRVRMLTPDLSLIMESIKDSEVVEISPDLMALRAKSTWNQWVLPLAQREALGGGTGGSSGGGGVPSGGGTTAAQPPASHENEGGSSGGGAIAAAAANSSDPSIATISDLTSPKAVLSTAIASSTPTASSTKHSATDFSKASAPEGNGDEDEEDEEDLFEMDEDQRMDRVGGGGGGSAGLTDNDLAKLIVVTQSAEKKRRPGSGSGGANGGSRRLDSDLAKIIDDGLAAYERELVEQRRNKPPRGPGGGGGGGVSHTSHAVHAKGPHFYGSSLTHGSYKRNSHGLPGESPPSHAFGWLMGTSPDTGSMFGTSPAGSYRR